MTVKLVSAGTAATGNGSVTPAFGQATTAGNMLVAIAFQSINGTLFAFSDSTWTQLPGSNVSSAGDFFFYAKPDCGSNETAPTITNTNNQPLAIVLAEFAGTVRLSPVYDKDTNAQLGTSPVTTGGGVGAHPGVDVTAGELLLACLCSFLSSAGTTTTSLTSNNATLTSLGNNDATSTAEHWRFAYGITTAKASTTTVTASDTSMNLTSLTGANQTILIPAQNLVPQFSPLPFVKTSPGIKR